MDSNDDKNPLVVMMEFDDFGRWIHQRFVSDSDLFELISLKKHGNILWLLCSPMFPHMFWSFLILLRIFVFLSGFFRNKSGKHPRNYSDKKRSQSNKSSTYLSWPNCVDLCSGSSPHESQILYDKNVWQRGTVTSCYPKHLLFWGARCFTCLSLELSYDVTPPESEDMKVFRGLVAGDSPRWGNERIHLEIKPRC